jgi:hypothetical protein
MPEITLTDAQYDQLEAIRADVEDAFVDTYGHARLEDAVDYLLDTYTPPDERDSVVVAEGFERIATARYPELQRIAAEVPDIPGSGIDADEMRGKLLAELGAVELAERLAETADEGDGSAETEPATDEDGNDAETADADDADTADEDDADTVDEDGESASDSPAESDSDAGGTVDPLAGPGNALSAVNKLLREHDDKWRKTETGDEPYEVDLPDGTTEGVRTKDDVRQYLFKHY